MMDIKQQIELGKLVCPKTKQKLFIRNEDELLETEDKKIFYKFLNKKTPILILDTDWVEKYIADSKVMNKDYRAENIRKRQTSIRKIKSKLTQDYRTKKSKEALLSIFDDATDNGIYLSIGGGPNIVDKRLINLNIGPFPNVDIVADAHLLPYSDGSVDAIHCEAVFEHLYNPVQAAKEMRRVLKVGGRVYICTPFMQAYHGYPHHYQNFTLTGHKHLFISEGFKIIESGVCVGPVYTIINLVYLFFSEYLPPPINKLFRKSWELLTIPLRPLDKILNKRKNAFVLASTTYLIAQK